MFRAGGGTVSRVMKWYIAPFLLLMSVKTYEVLAYGDDDFIDQWNRCRAIVKKNETRPCTGTQTTVECAGKKIWTNGVKGIPDYLCSSNTPYCPPPPSDLHADVYEMRVFKRNPELLIVYGLNISWTVQATGTPEDYQTKGFLLWANISSLGGIMLAKINLNLTEDDYSNGQATIYYDCICPIDRKVNSHVDIRLETLPHEDGESAKLSLETISGTRPSLVLFTQASSTTDPITKTVAPIEKTKASSGDEVDDKAVYKVSTQASVDKSGKTADGQKANPHTILVFTLVPLAAAGMVILMIACTLRHHRRRRDGYTMTGGFQQGQRATPTDPLVPSPADAEARNVLVTTDNSSYTHVVSSVY